MASNYPTSEQVCICFIALIAFVTFFVALFVMVSNRLQGRIKALEARQDEIGSFLNL